jgi:hypothetical protein
MWDEAVIMGRQGNEEISVHDMAKLKNSVSYDVLTGWRLRLRRKSVNGTKQTGTLISRMDANPGSTKSIGANS